MELKGKKLYYLLEGKKLTPQLKQLKDEFDKAVAEWNKAYRDLESDNLDVAGDTNKRLQKANEDLARIKKEIKQEKAAQK